jgi:hypothetical protein
MPRKTKALLKARTKGERSDYCAYFLAGLGDSGMPHLLGFEPVRAGNHHANCARGLRGGDCVIADFPSLALGRSSLPSLNVHIEQIDTIGGVPIYRDDKGAICFRAGCTVNADGSPHAYAPGNLHALDYLANAGEEGNWWGIATDRLGEPYLQSAWHPAPGFYVSTTALYNPDYPIDHPNRYVDSERYGFAVLPGGTDFAKLGDVGLALNQSTGDNMFFACADIGPRDSIGEGSILLSRCLGLNPNPKTGGTKARIINYVILPESDPSYKPWESKCQTAIRLVGNWGGLSRLKELSKMME